MRRYDEQDFRRRMPAIARHYALAFEAFTAAQARASRLLAQHRSTEAALATLARHVQGTQQEQLRAVLLELGLWREPGAEER